MFLLGYTLTLAVYIPYRRLFHLQDRNIPQSMLLRLAIQNRYTLLNFQTRTLLHLGCHIVLKLLQIRLGQSSLDPIMKGLLPLPAQLDLPIPTLQNRVGMCLLLDLQEGGLLLQCAEVLGLDR